MANRPRVLVVEDDPALRKVLALRLTMDGFDVEVAEDGQAGLEAATTHPPDVILTDLMIPRMGGDGLCRALRALPAADAGAVPIVLLTAHQRDATVDRVLDLGGITFMSKPFDAPTLAGTLRGLAETATSHPGHARAS